MILRWDGLVHQGGIVSKGKGTQKLANIDCFFLALIKLDGRNFSNLPHKQVTFGIMNCENE